MTCSCVAGLLTENGCDPNFVTFGDGVPRACQQWLMTPTSCADVSCGLVGSRIVSGSAFRPLTWFPALICRFAERSVNALGCIKRPYALPAYHETARCSRPSDHHRRSLLITGVVRPVTTHCSHCGSYRRRGSYCLQSIRLLHGLCDMRGECVRAVYGPDRPRVATTLIARRRTHTRSLARAALTGAPSLISHRKDRALSPVVQDSV